MGDPWAGSLSMRSTDEVVTEITRIHRSLPTRPDVEEVEAARALIQNVEREDQARLEAISKQTKAVDVPDELFAICQEMHKNLVYFHSNDRRREALKVLDLEKAHSVFDEFIQRASRCVAASPASSYRLDSPSAPSTTNPSTATNASSSSSSSSWSSSSSLSVAKATAGYYQPDREVVKAREMVSRDDTYVAKAKPAFFMDGVGAGFRSAKPQIVDLSLKPAGQDGDNKLSLIKLASMIEVSSKKGTRDLNLQDKLMDQVEWLPDSVGKLSNLITFDLSENHIVALPATIGGLSSLTRLDLHANRIVELPDSIGDLLSLVVLDLRGNHIASLPPTVGRLVRLEELDLSSNQLSLLPESIGSLSSLKKLNVETNNIEELPYTIGQCSSLRELRADYNKLKALPEAVGKIESLEILTIRYNNITKLPTTMSTLSNLKELDVSFNELESVPESLCFATTLVKMNLGNNFADLRSLPRSIGNLEMLEVLDISNNQIRFLPDSFRMLSKLRVLHAEENPLQVPPRHIAQMGAQAAVQYMSELVAKREVKVQPVKQKKTWSQKFSFFSRHKNKKRHTLEYQKV